MPLAQQYSVRSSIDFALCSIPPTPEHVLRHGEWSEYSMHSRHPHSGPGVELPATALDKMTCQSLHSTSTLDFIFENIDSHLIYFKINSNIILHLYLHLSSGLFP